jgi:phage baseplate assembly protein gpV
MIEFLTGQRIDIEMLKTRFGQMIRIGPIEEINSAKGYRIKLGDGDDGPFLSPWLPHPESGGQTSSWIPLSKGQVVGVLSPNGDIRQGVLLRGGFTDSNPAPSSDLMANVLKGLGATVTLKDGTLTVDCGLVKFIADVEIEGNLLVKGKVDFAAGHVKHNGTNIGDFHVHSGVIPGGADTEGPH